MLIREIAWRAPEAAFARFAGDRHVAWLDSAAPPSERSRTSYLAVDPFQTLHADAAGVTRDGRALALDPFAALAAELARHAGPSVPDAPVAFIGGAIGFLGYELASQLEDVPRQTAGALDTPDMAFGFYDLLLAFDHRQRRTWLLSSGLPETQPSARQHRGAARADWLLRRLAAPPRHADAVPRLHWRRETDWPAYAAALRRVLEYIAAGDIYQANYTTRFLAARPPGLHPSDLYAALRQASPAPFGAYLDCGPRLTIASASPERFVQLSAAGRIESRPIKGTRPRGASPEADAALRAALHDSEKDRAENLMIVDLLRHDIGRVAAIGSVRVPTLHAVESFASVHHLVSVIEGRLRAGLGPVDLLRATFPGGSVTGAPKIRAMQIIAELERAARGPYCGCIAWIGWDGCMDSSIVIRSAVVTPQTVAVQAGGGIVADSDPADEYREMMLKARPLLRALGPEPP